MSDSLGNPPPFIHIKRTFFNPNPFPTTHPWQKIALGLDDEGFEVLWSTNLQPVLTVDETENPTLEAAIAQTVLIHCVQKPEWRTFVANPHNNPEFRLFEHATNTVRYSHTIKSTEQLLHAVQKEAEKRKKAVVVSDVNTYQDLPEPLNPLMLIVDNPPDRLIPVVHDILDNVTIAGIHVLALGERRWNTGIEQNYGAEVMLMRSIEVTLPANTTEPITIDPDIINMVNETQSTVFGLTPNVAVPGVAAYFEGDEAYPLSPYRTPVADLPQIVEMSNALAAGIITIDDLLTDPE